MKTVLFVEDDKILLFALLNGFKAFSREFRFIAAENGQEALAVLKTEAVDIVITDLNMPVMDGFDLIFWIRFYFPSIIITVVTAFLPDKIDRELRQFVSNRILFKPLNFDALIKTVFELAENKPDTDIPSGISLNDYLKIAEIKKKTCLLEVFGAGEKRGRIYLRDGRPYDAVHGTNTGEGAFREMEQWTDVRVKMSDWEEHEKPA